MGDRRREEWMDGRNTAIEGSKVGWKERTERTDGMREINR